MKELNKDELLKQLDQCWIDFSAEGYHIAATNPIKVQAFKQLKEMVERYPEIDKLARFIMRNYPSEITGGSAVDVAIKIIKN